VSTVLFLFLFFQENHLASLICRIVECVIHALIIWRIKKLESFDGRSLLNAS
jgi:hypothetical protein